jgi:molybdate transport system substrate-binding protein
LQSLNLWDAVQSKLVFGNSVRQVLDYLRRGEVDAGLIYATDAVIGGDAVRVVEALETQTPIVYPVAITADTSKKDVAKIFLDFILTERGQTILQEFGFSAP